jgi:hypothetical protein
MVVGDAEGIAEKLEGVGAAEGPAVEDIKINAVVGIAVVELKLRDGICVVGLGDGGDVDTCTDVSLLAR